MDQNKTWHACRPRPWPHCIRWGPSSPSIKGGGVPQCSVHVNCGQITGWIKMPLDMELGLIPSDIVLDGDPAPLLKKGAEPPIFGPCLLLPDGWMDQDATWRGGRSRPRPHCVRCGPMQLPSPNGYSPQFSAHICCDQITL